jgi:hypothetical protein
MKEGRRRNDGRVEYWGERRAAAVKRRREAEWRNDGGLEQWEERTAVME